MIETVTGEELGKEIFYDNADFQPVSAKRSILRA